MKCFTLSNLTKTYGSNDVSQVVLDNISLSINQGELTAIAGSSGSGKSTLLSILSFMERADSGKLLYQGQSISHMNDNKLAAIRNKDFGFVFQSPFYVPYKTVHDNICLPLSYSNSSLVNAERRASELMEYVGIEHLATKLPSKLSGGEQQRMSFARALVMQPSVIFADEPTASLDQENSNKIMSMLCTQVDKGLTVILVSHDKHTLSYGNRVLELTNKGTGIVER